MSRFHGKDGQAKFGSDNAYYLADWMIETVVQVLPITPFDVVNGNNEYTTSFYDWRAELRCYLSDNGQNIADGTKDTLEIDTGRFKPKYRGNAICVATRKAASVNGYATVIYTFLGSGTLEEI